MNLDGLRLSWLRKLTMQTLACGFHRFCLVRRSSWIFVYVTPHWKSLIGARTVGT